MRWLLRPSEVRSRYSCTTYLASGNCKTSSIPLSPPTAADSLATGPTATNTPPSADNTLLRGSSRPVRLLDFHSLPSIVDSLPLPCKTSVQARRALAGPGCSCLSRATKVPSLCSLSHEDRNDCSRDERQRSYQAYGPGDPEGVGDDPGREGAHGVAEVPPETRGVCRARSSTLRSPWARRSLSSRRCGFAISLPILSNFPKSKSSNSLCSFTYPL
jgi:hypothetical protein